VISEVNDKLFYGWRYTELFLLSSEKYQFSYSAVTSSLSNCHEENVS